jgi:predicted acyl esterase
VQAALLNTPKSAADWNIWSFNHKVSHDAIRAAILAKTGVNLTSYEIDPISPADMSGWLQRHAQLHVEMDAALGQQSTDLQDVDLSDERQLISWIYLNYQEHRDAEDAAGVAS